MQSVNIHFDENEDYRVREAFKTLRSNIEFCGEDIKVIAVTSCTPNEGKSSVAMEAARAFAEAGFVIYATGSTCALLNEAGIEAKLVKKLYEGRPNLLDLITNGEIDLIVNSPVGDESEYDDSYLRKAAIKAKIPYMTTIAAAKATAEGILYVQKKGNGEVHSLQTLHGQIQDR